MTIHGQSLPVEAAQRPLLDGMRPQLSRRGFFASLRQMGEERVERALEEEPPPMLRPAVEIDKRLPRRLPHSRMVLLAQLAEMNTPEAGGEDKSVDVTGLPFASVEIETDACSAYDFKAMCCFYDLRSYFAGTANNTPVVFDDLLLQLSRWHGSMNISFHPAFAVK